MSDVREAIARAIDDGLDAGETLGKITDRVFAALEAWEPPDLGGMPFGSGAAWRALLAASKQEQP